MGLPVPAACGSICSILFFRPTRSGGVDAGPGGGLAAADRHADGVDLPLLSVKKLDLRRPLSYRVAVPIAAIMLVVYYMPRAVFLTLALGYTLSAPLGWLWGQLRPSSGPDPDATIPSTPPPPSHSADLP